MHRVIARGLRRGVILLAFAGLLMMGLWWLSQPKFTAKAAFALNKAEFAKIFDPNDPSPGPYFVQSAIEQILSQRTLRNALKSVTTNAFSPALYTAARSQLRLRKSKESRSDGTEVWIAEYRGDDPEKCARFVNAVLTSYDEILTDRLARKNYHGAPIFTILRPARKAL
jgi:hypothetical protein